MPRLAALQRNPLFHHVPPEAVREAAQIVTERQYAPGQVLLEQEAQGEALHLLVSGIVRVSRVSLGSRERVMGDIYAPGVIGETAMLSSKSERSATVTALTEVTTYMLHREHFKQLLRRYPDVLWNLSEMLTQRVTHLNDELIAFGQNTEAALSHVFSHLYHQRVQAGVPSPAELPLSITDIMQRISSSRETVSRVLKKLERQGFIALGSQSVTLLNLEGLEGISLEEADPVD